MQVQVHKDGMLWDVFGPFKGKRDLAMQRAIKMYDPFQKENASTWISGSVIDIVDAT